jgi:predicted enzyme involved in methoxymalonyl-ACP biosynthesis
MKQVRLALMGNYAMQFMARGIRKAATKRGMDLALHTTEYNTIDLDIINPASPLYDFAPDFILWHESTLALRDQFYAHAPEDREPSDSGMRIGCAVISPPWPQPCPNAGSSSRTTP